MVLIIHLSLLLLSSLLGRKRNVLLHPAVQLLHRVIRKIVRVDLRILHEALQDVLFHVCVEFVDLVVLAQAVLAAHVINFTRLRRHVLVQFRASLRLPQLEKSRARNAVHPASVKDLDDPVGVQLPVVLCLLGLQTLEKLIALCLPLVSSRVKHLRHRVLVLTKHSAVLLVFGRLPCAHRHDF